MTFGQKIRERRKELGYSQGQLTMKMGMRHASALCNYEKDRAIPTLFTAIDIASALKCTVYDLIGEEDIGVTRERERIAEMVADMIREGVHPTKIVEAIRRGER